MENTRETLMHRSTPEAVHAEEQRLLCRPEVCGLLNAVPNVLLLLNEHRQVVFANRSLLALLGLTGLEQVYGRRPGEVLDCDHAGETAGGCGTADACAVCGAARAISACERGAAAVQECRIIQKCSGGALDLRISATPVPLNGQSYTVLSVTDISDEKRRKAIERIFFHDLLNTAGAIMGYAELLSRATVDQFADLSKSMHRLSASMVEEIRAQWELAAAENNDFTAHFEPVGTREMLASVEHAYRNHDVSQQRLLEVDPQAANESFLTDKTLLRRVLGNMVKNALEAARPGETVRMGCEVSPDSVEFWVHNPGQMPRDVQLQIFQRSFSTKGVGRGLGTYSIKLLSERYLRGRVSFTSTAAGTTFRARYPRR
jgi:hypothetical protein